MAPENIRLKAGVVGLGALGAPVAGLLLKAGHPVAVYDVRSEPVAESQMLGARACASPAEVAQHSDIVISLVSDRAQTDDIVFGSNGMRDHLQAGAILAIGSTLGPEPVRHIAQKLAARDVEVLDIPISGGILAAREGTLSLMAGGRAETLARAQRQSGTAELPPSQVVLDDVIELGPGDQIVEAHRRKRGGAQGHGNGRGQREQCKQQCRPPAPDQCDGSMYRHRCHYTLP